VFALLAAIGLTVGLIFALTPLITAWGATAVVIVLLLVGAWLCVRRVMAAIRRISGAMGSGSEPGA